MSEDTKNTDTDTKVAELEKRLEALARKNEELLSEVKAEREKRREAETARQEAEEAARAKEEEAATKAGDIDALKQQLEARHARELEKLTQRAQEAESQLHKLVIDGGIRDALAKAEIAPKLAKGAALAFKDGRNIEVKDGTAYVDGVPLADAVNEWAESEEGSVYKAAGLATGGGAPGGSNSVSRPLAELSESERVALYRRNPAEFQRLMGAG